MIDRFGRASGALIGLAIGDALGMPVQEYSRDEVSKFFDGKMVFKAARADHPYAHGLGRARITDDTEQSFIIADLLIAKRGHVTAQDVALALEDWEGHQIELGRADLLGPSTKRALLAYRSGVPIAETGTKGTTNGAAMRIAPVGIAFDVTKPDSRLVLSVREIGLVTHNTGIANAGATLIASLISRLISGVDVWEALDDAYCDADTAQQFGNQTEHELLSAMVRRAISSHGSTLASDVEISSSVPTAIACVFAHLGQPLDALIHAVSLGGDTDTIASIAGSISGACHGYEAWPREYSEEIVSINSLQIDHYARKLLELRDRG